MDAITTLRDLRRAGYTATVSDGKLKLRGPGPPEELEASILANRDEIIRLIVEDIIVDEREVFARAREHFGLDEEGGAA
jgi:hypothetical protein